jgi:hypothetical protein
VAGSGVRLLRESHNNRDERSNRVTIAISLCDQGYEKKVILDDWIGENREVKKASVSGGLS